MSAACCGQCLSTLLIADFMIFADNQLFTIIIVALIGVLQSGVLNLMLLAVFTVRLHRGELSGC